MTGDVQAQTIRTRMLKQPRVPSAGTMRPVGDFTIAGFVGTVSKDALMMLGSETTIGNPPLSFVSAVDADALVRRRVASEFAQVVSHLAGVETIRLLSTRPDLRVAVVTTEEDFDRELELRGIFIEMMVSRLDASEGELSVYERDDAPEWVAEGEPLI